MIPLALTIKGINSYQQEMTIDFSKLLQGQLFGIFGPVGSGKSTILEAIMLALYGETDKLNKSGDQRHYNLMNLRSNELKVDFTFQAGQQQDIYRCFYRTKRHSKNHHEVKSPEHKAYKQSAGEWMPITLQEIEAAIGLNYTNFKKTIIIPQGKFQEFLQLTPADRTKMLKDIFGLEKFDLGAKVRDLRRNNELALSHLEGQLEHLKAVSEENLASLGNEIVQLNQDLENQSQLVQSWKKWLQLANTFAHIAQQHQAISKEIDQAHQQLTTTKTNIKDFEASFVQIKSDFDQLENQQQHLQQLQQLTRLKGLEVKTQTAQKTLKTHQSNVNKVNQQLAQTIDSLGMIRQKLRKLKTNQPNLKALYQLKEWWSEKARLISQIQVFDAEIQQITAEQTHYQTTFLANKFKAEHHITSFEQGRTFLNNLDQSTTLELQKLQVQLHEVAGTVKLGEWSASLQEGEPCPLCGAIHHPDLFDEQEAKTKQQNLGQSIEQKNNLLARIRKGLDELNQAAAKHQQFEVQTKDRIKQRQALSDDLEKHLSREPQDQQTFTDLTAVNQAIESAETHQKIIAQNEDEQETLQKVQGQKQQKYLALNEQLQEVQRDISSLQGSQKQLKGELSTDLLLQYSEIAIEDIEQEIQALTKTIQDTKTAFEKGQQQLQSLWQQQHSLEGQLTANKANQVTLQMELDQLSEQWHLQTQPTNLTKEPIPKISALATIQKRYQEHEGQYDQLRQVILEKKHQQKQWKADLDKRNTLQTQQQSLATRKSYLNTLANLFKGNGFVDYISSIYLEELCELANERFRKLTRQRLSLAINDKNQFIVRDYLNQGNTRNVKNTIRWTTFSGVLILSPGTSRKHQTSTWKHRTILLH